jgi:hypothetical protein
MGRADGNIISQCSVRGGPRFQFNESHLGYFGILQDFKVKYEEIAGPSQYQRRKSSDLVVRLAFGYLILFASVMMYRDHGLYQGWDGFYRMVHASIIFIAILVGVLAPLHFLTHKEYTVIPTRSGKMLVLRDRRHDAVVERLQAERLRSLRALSEPNPANSPAEELGKLKWLRDEGAITEAEYLLLCSRAAA